MDWLDYIALLLIGGLAGWFARAKIGDKAQETAKAQFENLANEILKKTGADFKEQSQEALKNLIDPLGAKLTDFGKEITGFKAINERMTSETENLTKALTANVKAQGNWGELTLERILEEAGLERGREYTVQGEGLDIKSADGGRQMPDVIINLPEGRHLVIDSKVSLQSFIDYNASDAAPQRQAAIADFIASTDQHIKGLAGKNYASAYGLKTLDFVMMFMPMDAAFMLLISEREDFLTRALDKNISIVSPATLLPTLKAIGYLWRMQKQNENAEEIARLGGTIYDKVVGFLGDMKDVGKNLGRAQNSYDDAVKKLDSGKGSVTAQAEKLKTLGAKTSKSLPDISES